MGSDEKINICHIISGDLWAGAEMAAYTLIAGLLSCPEFELSAITMNEGILSERLRETGIKTTVIDESSHTIGAIIRIARKTLLAYNVDIVHTHRFKENIIGGLIKKPCHIKALIKTIHGSAEPFKGIKGIKTRSINIVDNCVGAIFFDKIIAVSDYIKNRVEPAVARKKTITIHNSIDPQKIAAIKSVDDIKLELGIPADKKIVGYAGRLVAIKGLDLLLNSANLISKNREDVVFVIVGDGPERQNLENLVTGLKLQNYVYFTGFRSDIINVMSAFDILTLTSYNEGVPMVLLEGMALGIPVVSTSVGGITEVIEDGSSGLLVKSRDPEDLASAYLEVLDSPVLKNNLKSGAMQRLKFGFSLETQIEKISRIYKEFREAK